jgi:hypothetical protein
VAESLCTLGLLNWGKGFLSQDWEEALLPIEQLVAVLNLGISRTLHLDPRLTVLAFLRLHDNAFEIEVVHEVVEVRAVVGMIDVEKMWVLCRNEFAKDLLAHAGFRPCSLSYASSSALSRALRVFFLPITSLPFTSSLLEGYWAKSANATKSSKALKRSTSRLKF